MTTYRPLPPRENDKRTWVKCEDGHILLLLHVDRHTAWHGSTAVEMLPPTPA